MLSELEFSELELLALELLELELLEQGLLVSEQPGLELSELELPMLEALGAGLLEQGLTGAGSRLPVFELLVLFVLLFLRVSLFSLKLGFTLFNFSLFSLLVFFFMIQPPIGNIILSDYILLEIFEVRLYTADNILLEDCCKSRLLS